MKTTTTLLTLVFLAGAARAANAHDADPNNDGWIAHSNDHQLEIYYKTVPPAVGQTVQILRSSFINVNKTVLRQQFRPSDLARITAATSTECLKAQMIEGSTSRADHARSIDEKANPMSRH